MIKKINKISRDNVLMALKEKILLETFKIIKQDIPYIAGPNYALWWDYIKKKLSFILEFLVFL